MPQYQFRCKQCNQAFELIMSIRDKEAANISCPKCGSTDCVQNYSGNSIITQKTQAKPSGGCCGNCSRCG